MGKKFPGRLPKRGRGDNRRTGRGRRRRAAAISSCAVANFVGFFMLGVAVVIHAALKV